MKNIILAFSMLTLILLSCSKDEDTVLNKEIITFIGIDESQTIRIQVNAQSKIIIADLEDKIGVDTLNIDKIDEWISLNIPNNSIVKYPEGSISKLDCSSTSIKELKGFDTDSYIRINNVDVSNCSKLKELNCVGLVTLNAVNCTSLESVDFSQSSELTSLDFTGCLSLIEIGCGESGLVNIDVSDCDKLKTLSLNKNVKLSTVNISGCSQLEYIDCSGCEILSLLDLSDCIGLKEIYSNGASNLSNILIPLQESSYSGFSISCNDCESLNILTCSEAKNIDAISVPIKNNQVIRNQCEIAINNNTEKYQFTSGSWVKK